MAKRMKRRFSPLPALLAPLLVAGIITGCAVGTESAAGTDKLAYHYGADRQGWNDAEAVLTPENVSSENFGIIWQSPQLDYFHDVPPRLFASPLFINSLRFEGGELAGKQGPVAFAASTAGYAYAIAAGDIGQASPGDIIWRRKLTDSPCMNGQMGILSTPVIDLEAGRIYVTSCSSEWLWHINALDLQSGEMIDGWPLEVSHETVTADINRNGSTSFIQGQPYIQRGALTLSADAGRLYVAFGPDMQGWLLSVDTENPAITSAFSSMPSADMQQGGMWGSSGPAIDAQGRIYVATGASFANALANGGIAGVFPDRDHAWGQSILQFTDSAETGLELTGTYAPFNYCQTAAADIDIAGSGPVIIDLDPAQTSTPSLLTLGAGKQGNAYLLDRDNMPGNLVRRQACSSDGSTDGSLLAPDVQPELGTRGPVSIFGPYSDDIGMANSAKSRSTLAHFRDAAGAHFLYLTGTTKTGPDFSTNIAPSLVRVSVNAEAGQPAFLRRDLAEMTQVMQNPGSPVVSSNGGTNGIVWVLDPNVPRSTDLYDPRAPGARLYAFDASDLTLLWASGDEMRTSGKYNEAAVVNGMVLVGTDRLQAFGLREAGYTPVLNTSADRALPAPVAGVQSGAALFDARCASCHGASAAGAPSIAALAAMPRDQVLASLKQGKMKEMAAGLSDDEISAIVDALPALPS